MLRNFGDFRRYFMRRNLSWKTIIPWGFTFAILFAAIGLLATRRNANGQNSGDIAKINLSSPSFTDGQPIPKQYTCDGRNVSPPLQWSGVPQGTLCLALICQDPDAPRGTFTHWAIYGLTANTTELPEGIPNVEMPPVGGRQGANGFNKFGYGGPCPPSGETHHYIFTIFALNNYITLHTRATGPELLGAIQNHVIGQGELTGTYKKR